MRTLGCILEITNQNYTKNLYQPIKGSNGFHGQKIGLNDSHFDAVIENLGATLTELGVAPELIQEAAGIAESTRKHVLNR